MSTYTFEIQTDVAAAPDFVWRQATDMRSVNLELSPLIRMTYPWQLRDLNAAATLLRHRLFRSWILLFGVLPIDFYGITFVAIEPGRRFLERSSTLNYRLWQHERVIETRPSGTRIIDRLVITPRLRFLGPPLRGFVRALFNLRHKNLLKRFGAATPHRSLTDHDDLKGGRATEEILVL